MVAGHSWKIWPAKLKLTNTVQIHWCLVLPWEDIVSNTYYMESILQVNFFRGKLFQLLQASQAMPIPKTTLQYGGNFTGTSPMLEKSFLEKKVV